MRIVEITVALLWVVFWVTWIVAAVHAKRDVAGSRRFLLARLLVVVAVVALVRFNILETRAVFRTPPALQYAGIALLVCGLALALWARAYLGTNWGTPMSVKADPELVTTGPYSRVRHPIYTGIILAMLGTACAAGIPWLVGAVALAGFFVYSATVEERAMAQLFPATYPEYRRTTRMLVPFVF